MTAKAKARARPAKRRKTPGPAAGDETNPRAADAAAAVAAENNADAALLVLTVATLTPVVELLMDFTKASAERTRRATEEASRADTASLTALAAAVNRLLSPHPSVPRNPAVT
jgi:hypothetical protein